MLEILKFIFSNFWIWLGAFLMLVVICDAADGVIRTVLERVGSKSTK